MFVAKALEYTPRRVVLLTVNRSVLLQNTVDDIREGGQFRAFRWLAAAVARRLRVPAASSSPSLAPCQTDSPPLAGSDHQHGRPAERADIGPRCTSSRLSISKKIEGYRWRSFTPPAAGKSRRFRGLICHRRSHDRLDHARGLGMVRRASAERPVAAPIGGRGPSNNVITAPSIIVNTLTRRPVARHLDRHRAANP